MRTVISLLTKNKNQLLLVDSLRYLYGRIRYEFYMRTRGIKTIESKDAYPVTVKHNLSQLRRNLLGDFIRKRMELLIRPLSVIEALTADARFLIIGPRTEADILRLKAYGFHNIRAVDLISYSPWIDLGDMHNLPYASDMFDVVICGWTISYSSSPKKAADEMIRVIRNRGIIAIGVEYSDMSPEDVEKIYGYSIVPKESDDKRINSVEEILSLFSGYVHNVLFRHDASLTREHFLERGETQPDPLNNAVIFSVKK